MANATTHASFLPPVLTFLTAAVVGVPIVRLLGQSAVLGYLVAGVVIGPSGFSLIAEPETAASVAEIGVVLLLFIVGLELELSRLVSMRRDIFGLGAAQLAVCALILAGAGALFGLHAGAATVIGVALALSATAVALQLLEERGDLGTSYGSRAFAVLLFQDISVVAILALLPLMASAGGTPEGGWLSEALHSGATAAGAILGVVLIGRYGLNPLFRLLAASGGREVMTAAALLVVLGTALIMEEVGLSMAMGAFLAGVMLAESNFRHQLEADIEPFRGMLLGLFFMSVGMSIDGRLVAAQWPTLFGATALAIGVKILLVALLFRLFGSPWLDAVRGGAVLAPAGEFAFVVFATGMVEGIAPPALTSTVALSATLSIFSIPLLALLGQRLSRAKAPDRPTTPEGAAPPEQADGAVIVVGFGRVGRLIGELLKAHDQPFIALDTDAAAVAAGRRDGFDVFYGDAGRPEMLSHCGVQTTRALIVTMDAPGKVDEVVTAARALREDLILIARARDDQHAARLYALGVTDAVPETTEASLQLAENTLVDLGVPMGRVLVSIHEKREQFRRAFQAAMPAGGRSRTTRALRMSQINTAKLES